MSRMYNVVMRDVIYEKLVERAEREKKSIGKALVHGFGLKDAAIASTVAHDSHQLICVGSDYELMLLAIMLVKEVGGGQAVVTHEGYTLLPLPFGGIISTLSIDKLVKKMEELHSAANAVSKGLSDPFMAMSFIALPVIPHLKVTDKGLIDVDKFEFTSLVVE